jgi:hypothetical protein
MFHPQDDALVVLTTGGEGAFFLVSALEGALEGHAHMPAGHLDDEARFLLEMIGCGGHWTVAIRVRDFEKVTAEARDPQSRTDVGAAAQM